MATELRHLTASTNSLDCNRGELRLTPAELHFINESLSKNNQSYFRLDLVADVSSGSKKQPRKEPHNSLGPSCYFTDSSFLHSSSVTFPSAASSVQEAIRALRKESNASSVFQTPGESPNSFPASSTDAVPAGSQSADKPANSCSTHSGSSSRSTNSSRSEINAEASARKSLNGLPSSTVAISTDTSALLSSASLSNTITSEPSHVPSGAFSSTTCAATTSTTGAANGDLDENDALERWRMLCRSVMVTLCDDMSAGLFASLPFGSMSTSEGALERLAKDVAPAVPISITEVIAKLDTDGYASFVEFVADVDTVWTCAFRASEPGSHLWMEAHRASLVFRNLLEHEKLLDFVIMPEPRKHEQNAAAEKMAGEAESLPESTVGQQQVDQPGEEQRPHDEQVVDSEMGGELGDQNGSEGGTPSSSNEGASTGEPGVAGTIDTSTCAEDRKRFEDLLGTLTQEQHLQLYDLFQQTAVWKEMPDGVVELDDKRTSVEVFRQMVLWCEGNTEESVAKHLSEIPEHSGSAVSGPGETTDELQI
eukprot:GHVS01076375.1.p1 GENE.GHVS01076375.1~~GHVS01076375.1.p1  ORF type:complete len:537 (+),score=74.83 GHVS01076375.1:77-1687(+)